MKRNEINALPLAGDVSFRESAAEPGRTALLLIDLQNGEYNEQLVKAEPQNAYFWNRLGKTVIPNGQKLLAACRGAGVEVLFTTVECYTLDGRDRSLDYKVSGIFFAKGSWEAQVFDELKPLPNEIVIPKMSSSVFVSTNIAYVLRNLGIEYLMVDGPPHRSVRGIRGARCLRPWLPGDADRGRLRYEDPGTSRRDPSGHQRLLPPAQDGAGPCRTGRMAETSRRIAELRKTVRGRVMGRRNDPAGRFRDGAAR